MEQFAQFKINKQAVITHLDQLRAILHELGELGADVENDLQKIDDAVQTIEADVLRIALLGAFSDGKTSVVAGWLGRVMADMKIDMDESSDRLEIYKPEGLPDKCEIIDTPGLFGDKEKTDGDKQVAYQDLTKNYISQAHIILYVVDATNPLKESHSAIAKWVLRDLNKLSSTIFVINKMDEVTDLTEPELFNTQATTKKDNLKIKLGRAANLTPNELANLNIVCIASNPNGKGLEHWFNQPEQYESRSRITDLKAMTTRILQNNVSEELIAKTGMDVVCEMVSQHVTEVKEQLGKLDVIALENDEEFKRINHDISKGRKEIKNLAGELFVELTNLEKTLLSQLRPLSLERIRSFLEDEIGYTKDSVGNKLLIKIKTAVDRSFDHSSKVTNRISLDISHQLDSSESFLDAMSESSLKSMSGAFKGIANLSKDSIKMSIFAARDTLKTVTGTTIKFKPWEASKLAGNLSKWAGPAGATITVLSDGWSMYSESQREEELKKIKDSITTMIQDAFKDIYEIIGDDEKLFDFFGPQLKEFNKVIETIDEQSKRINLNQEKFIQVQEKLSVFTHASRLKRQS